MQSEASFTSLRVILGSTQNSHSQKKGKWRHASRRSLVCHSPFVPGRESREANAKSPRQSMVHSQIESSAVSGDAVWPADDRWIIHTSFTRCLYDLTDGRPGHARRPVSFPRHHHFHVDASSLFLSVRVCHPAPVKVQFYLFIMLLFHLSTCF